MAETSASVQEELEEHVLAQVEAEHGLSTQTLAALHSVFHESAVAALDILDRAAVTEISCPAGRVAYQVAGKGGRLYFTLVDQRFCECASFEYNVLRNDASMCKHVLAVRLAIAIGSVKKEAVTNGAFAARMCPSTV